MNQHKRCVVTYVSFKSFIDDPQQTSPIRLPSLAMSTFCRATGMFIGSAVVAGVIWPLSAVVVRYQAHYSPKGIKSQSKDGLENSDVQPHTAAVASSFLGMLRRVKRLEVTISHPAGAGPLISYLTRAGRDFTPRE